MADRRWARYRRLERRDWSDFEAPSWVSLPFRLSAPRETLIAASLARSLGVVGCLPSAASSDDTRVNVAVGTLGRIRGRRGESVSEAWFTHGCRHPVASSNLLPRPPPSLALSPSLSPSLFLLFLTLSLCHSLALACAHGFLASPLTLSLFLFPFLFSLSFTSVPSQRRGDYNRASHRALPRTYQHLLSRSRAKKCTQPTVHTTVEHI